MVNHLGIPQLLILLGKLISYLVQLFLQNRLPVVKLGNIIINPQEFFLQLTDQILLLGFIGFRT